MKKTTHLPFLALLIASTAHAQSTPPQSFAVGPQYDSTHVYVAPADIDAFIVSFIATFGGAATPPAVTNIAPVPSSARFQAVRTPVGGLSVFAFSTPIPYPFGQERTGYLVTNMEQAIQSARAAGAEILVAPFKDPIGIDAILQWPGGVKMQLYWHFKSSTNPPFATIPENRVYLSPDRADEFVRDWLTFSKGHVLSEQPHANASEIGRPGESYRRIRITSLYGNTQISVTDGHLPYPYGLEITGYEVPDLAATLQKAQSSGAKILVPPNTSDTRTSAIVEFPGHYIAEIHTTH
jgi:predicted enzyme related to lactoylglutathione lyase